MAAPSKVERNVTQQVVAPRAGGRSDRRAGRLFADSLGMATILDWPAPFGLPPARLLVLLLLVRQRAARAGRVLSYTVVPKPVHYVQLAMHTSIYLYWGWYWREVYHYAPLIVAQIVFVYVLDMLVCWWRRDQWILGFGPFPIVLSTNLFLWFKDDWFFLQFLLVSTGVLCKEFLTWRRDGRRTHIFNPSAIALAIFSIGLLITHSTHLTWGEEVAVSQGRPPHIYLEIFAVGLVVQALFSVTLVTLAAAGALFVLNLAYTGTTGVYYFVDSNIPIAVFLGLHLLVTDPATSPRRNFGKLLFGAMYGALVWALYTVLGWMGAPTFYDKLLCVPPLNLLVQPLDRAGAALEARFRKMTWTPRQVNFAHMAVWITLVRGHDYDGFRGRPASWQRSGILAKGLRVREAGCLPDMGPHHDSLVPARQRVGLPYVGSGVERRTRGAARSCGVREEFRARLRSQDAVRLSEPGGPGEGKRAGSIPARDATGGTARVALFWPR